MLIRIAVVRAAKSLIDKRPIATAAAESKYKTVASVGDNTPGGHRPHTQQALGNRRSVCNVYTEP